MNDVKPTLQPNEVADGRDGLILDAAQRASRYLKGVRERRVAPTPEAIAGLDCLTGEMPDRETAADAVLEMLDAFGSPATVANAGGRYFGFVNGGATPAALAANVLAAAWDQNTALRVMSPAATVLEETALGWIRDLLGLPPGSGGSFVSGATMATFTCLAAARQALLAAQGWDVESHGLFDAPPVQVIVSEEVHIAVKKALGLLGIPSVQRVGTARIYDLEFSGVSGAEAARLAREAVDRLLANPVIHRVTVRPIPPA